MAQVPWQYFTTRMDRPSTCSIDRWFKAARRKVSAEEEQVQFHSVEVRNYIVCRMNVWINSVSPVSPSFNITWHLRSLWLTAFQIVDFVGSSNSIAMCNMPRPIQWNNEPHHRFGCRTWHVKSPAQTRGSLTGREGDDRGRTDGLAYLGKPIKWAHGLNVDGKMMICKPIGQEISRLIRRMFISTSTCFRYCLPGVRA